MAKRPGKTKGYRKIIFLILSFYFAIELVSYICLAVFSAYLPAPVMRSFDQKKFDNNYFIDPYSYGCISFDQACGWNDFSEKPHRADINDLLDNRPVPKRIDLVTIGDSFTYSSEVDYQESWPACVEKGSELRVVNMGTPGYGMDQAYLKALEYGLALKPGFMAFCLDFGSVARNLGRVNNYYDHFPGKPVLKPRFIIDNNSLKLLSVPFKNKEEYNKKLDIKKLYELSEDDGWYNFYKRVFNYDVIKGWSFPYSFDFIGFSIAYSRSFRKGITADFNNIITMDNLEENLEAYKITYLMINEFARKCRESGVKPIIFFLTQGPEDKLDIIKDLCLKLNLPFVNIFEYIQSLFVNEGINPDMAFFKGSGHYNIFSNNLIGQYVQALLKKDFFVLNNFVLNNINQSDNSFFPDFGGAFFSVYSGSFLRALPGMLSNRDNMPFFARLLESPLDPDVISSFASKLDSLFNTGSSGILKQDLANTATLIKRFARGMRHAGAVDYKKTLSQNRISFNMLSREIPGWNMRAQEVFENNRNNFFNILTKEFSIKKDRIKDALREYKKGYESIIKKNFRKAGNYFKNALALEPGFIDAAFSCSLACVLSHDFKGDRALLKQALKSAYYANASDPARLEYMEYLIELIKYSQNSGSLGNKPGSFKDVSKKQFFFLLPDMAGFYKNNKDSNNLDKFFSAFSRFFNKSDSGKGDFKDLLLKYACFRAIRITENLDIHAPGLL